MSTILATHGHADKLGGLDAALAANPGAKAYIHKLDYAFLRDPVLNCSVNNGFSLIVQADGATFEEGGYDLGGYAIEIIHTPGHTAGSSLFYFPEENLLFGGDTIMATMVGSSRHPTGSAADRAASIQKFKQRTFPGDMRIFSGHGDSATYARLMQTNADLR